MDAKELEFFKNREKGKILFTKVVNQSKKKIVYMDDYEFLEEMGDQIRETCGMSDEEAIGFATFIYRIWEECGCSITAFDREMASIKNDIFQ